MDNYNDTICASSNEESQNEVKNEKKNHTAAKVAAGVIAGVGTGAGGEYGVNEYLDSQQTEQAETKPQETEQSQDEVKPETAEDDKTAAAHSAHTHDDVKPTETFSASSHNASVTDHVSTSHESTDTNVHQTSNTQEGTPVEMKVQNIQTIVGEDGQVQHIASAQIDGHSAVLADDGHGNMVAAGIDANDNGQIDNDEVVDLRGSGMTMGDVAAHMVEQNDVHIASVSQQEHDVQVVSVGHDDELGDVAVVSVDGDQGMFIDKDTDGNVDFIVHDDNGNQHIEENEIHQVNHDMTMPTLDDIADSQSNMASNDELPDYSNDADITTYEI